MARGGVSGQVIPGGGQQRVSQALQSKTVASTGVAPGGTPGQIYRLSSISAIVALLKSGPLAEEAAIRHRDGLDTIVAPQSPSTDGKLSAVTHVGTGTATITPSLAPDELVELMIAAAGAIGTMKFRWRVGGSGAWSDPVATTGSAPFVFRVPRTFDRLSFAAATYVIDKTWSHGVDGVATPGSGWVGVVTPTASPIDYYEVLITVVKAGLPGVGVLRVSLDNGATTLPDMAVPSTGVLVVPDTGLVLTVSGTLVEDETYSFLALPPGSSSQDADDVMDAIRADDTLAISLIHDVTLPSSTASAMSQASAMEVAVQAACDDGEGDWEAIVEAPYVGDLVVSGGAAILDTADTEAVIRAAREDLDLRRTSVFVGTHQMPSALRNWKPRRPAGWAVVARYVDTEPREDPSAREPRGPLIITKIGRNEATATQSLEDVQINVVQRVRGRNGAFLTISNGGYGWKNLTTQDDFQDAGGVRALNVGVAALRPACEALVGQRPPVNADGTIEEQTRLSWSSRLDKKFKRSLGLLPGGDFRLPQVSSATAKVLASSQLGGTPHRLDVEYTLQRLGFVSSVSFVVHYFGLEV
jgi:hypothetical protein